MSRDLASSRLTYQVAAPAKLFERKRSATSLALVHIDAEGIVCDLHVRFIDRRDRRATYELIAANRSATVVTCRIYEIDEFGRTREFGMMSVRTQSAGSSFFAIPLPAVVRRRIYVEVIGAGINLFAEAFQANAPAKSLFAPLALGGMAAAAIVAVATFALERPSIQTLSVPPTHATPGVVFATYAIGGQARGHYLARTLNGAPIAEGALSSPSGSIEIPVPSRAVGSAVRLSLDAIGPFGHAKRTLTFRVVAPPRAPASLAGIESLSARRESAGAGSSVIVSYVAHGEGGLLALATPTGNVLASVPFVRSGTTRFALSGPAGAGPINARLVVESGSSRATSAIDLDAVAVGHSAGSAVAPPVKPATAVAAAPRLTLERVVAADEITIPTHIFSGETLTLSVSRPQPGLRIAFEDAMKAVVGEVEVPKGGGRVSFSVPASTTKETYYLASSIDRGSSIETYVRALSVYPR